MIGRVIEKMIGYFSPDLRRVNHALKVTGLTAAIADMEGITGQQRKLTLIAAILHDIGIHEAERKHGSTAGKWQEMEGPDVARQLLADFPLEAADLDRICFIIGHHHSYGEIDGIDFQMVVEADLLVNAEEEEISAGATAVMVRKYFRTNGGKTLAERMYPSV